ncbi:MAG: YggS family pyridoxal phosphate-dependent enzyme [Gudongella sp.]|nr:YggS family pyridoxal phosphate-dependent enzyme [Gudongella sp.]
MEVIKISIADNIKIIKENVNQAIANSSRSNDVKIIAVTKTLSAPVIELALNEGMIDIGENKVQELIEKMTIFKDRPNYHMIGHLQSNKVRYIIDNIYLIHSLDRESLAKEIDKRAKSINKIIDCLIQVNISEEESKFGIKEEEVISFVEKLLQYSNINIKGLMTIAPFTQEEKIIRESFSGLYELNEKLKSRNYKELDMNILSMGMSNDYKIAIEEGSNMVRLGTAIFGKRNY